MSGYAWSKDELDILTKHFHSGGARLVNQMLPHRTLVSIYLRASKLGISKPGKPVQTKSWVQERRISHPAPGVTIHRLL